MSRISSKVLKVVGGAVLTCALSFTLAAPASASTNTSTTPNASKPVTASALTQRVVSKYDRYVTAGSKGKFAFTAPASLQKSDPAGVAAVIAAVSTANKHMATVGSRVGVAATWNFGTPSAKTDWHWWGYTRELNRYYTQDASWTLEDVAGGFAICSGATFFLPPVAGACGIEAGSYWIMGNDAGRYYSHGHCININMTWVSAWWDNEVGYRQGICY